MAAASTEACVGLVCVYVVGAWVWGRGVGTDWYLAEEGLP